MPPRGRFLATLLAFVFPASAAQSQASLLRLRSDNDVYRFWVPAAQRPDQEYSNGLQIEREKAGAPLWGRLVPGLEPCGAAERSVRCATTTLSMGQKIYTPRVDDSTWVPGQRPYAGLLYGSATASVATTRLRRSAGVELGVTGDPSGARWVQTRLHRAFGLWSPLGWKEQIPFEPALLVRYDEQRRLHRRSVAELVPAWGVSAGNVRTEARASLRGRLGYGLDAAWPPPQRTARAPFSVYAVGEVRGRAVAHDLFLDGSTLGGGPRVSRIPWVGEWEAGIGLRVHGFSAEYRVITRGREYRTEPGGHQYATFDLSLSQGL